MTSPTITILQSRIPYAVHRGELWFPIIPVSDALEVDSKNQFRLVKRSPLLKPYSKVLTLYIRGNQRRRYLCLPQQRVMMWIAKIRSKSKDTLKLQNLLADAISEACSYEYKNIKDLLEYQKAALAVARCELALADNKDYQMLKATEANVKALDNRILELAEGLIQ